MQKSKNRVVLAVISAFFPVVSYADIDMSTSSKAYFGTTQSFIEEFQGAPLISANWEGRYRPYLYLNDKFEPLFSDADIAAYAATDFYNPTPIDATHVLVYGEHNNEKNMFLFNASTKKLDLLYRSTDDPISAEFFSACVSRDNALIAYPNKEQEHFYQVNMDTRRLTELSTSNQNIPRLESCIWTKGKQLLGALHTEQGFQLAKCELNQSNLQCRPTNAFSGFTEITSFFEQDDKQVGVIGIKAGESFRKAYLFSEDATQLKESTLNKKIKADIVEIQNNVFRVDSESRFFTNLEPSSSHQAIISKLKNINSRWYAIAGDPYHNRTLAIFEKNNWKMLSYFPMLNISSINSPQEVWTTSEKGERYQSFYYGKPNAEKIVIWLHGGPKGNASPRFNSYMYDLNKKGYGVLAVNYPGSTGRGFKYESMNNAAAHLNCMVSVFQYLKKNKVKKVIVWSVSYADKLQKEMLENHLPVSAIVDQVGLSPSESLKKLADEQHIPYFSIRGKYDLKSIAKNPDFSYLGGHDINDYRDYDQLFEKITPFLDQAKPWMYETN